MPGLVLDGLTVPVAPEGFDRQPDDSVDRGRMIDGSLRQSVLYQKTKYRVTTPPLSEATRSTLLTKLRSGVVMTATGDLIESGSVSVLAEREGERPVKLKSGIHWVVVFTLAQT